MAVEHSEELMPRVRALLADTAELCTAAGLGFVGTTPAVSERAGAALSGGPWHTVDARTLDAEAARAALDAALVQKKPVLLLVNDDTPPIALRMARAFADRRRGGPSRVDLGDRKEHPIAARQSLVVVVDGIGEHAALPEDLKQVDFWEFLA